MVLQMPFLTPEGLRDIGISTEGLGDGREARDAALGADGGRYGARLCKYGLVIRFRNGRGLRPGSGGTRRGGVASCRSRAMSRYLRIRARSVG